MRRALCVLALLSLACTGGSDGEPIDEPADADTDVDADTDTDTDADADSGDYWEPGEPTMTATFDGTDWVAEDGHWLAGSTSYITGVRGDAELVLVIDGDVSKRGTYDVDDVTWFETVHNGYAFEYTTQGGSATITIEGRDVDSDHIWGTFDGSIDLTDSVGGGSTSLDAVELESWLRYGAQ